MKVLKYVYYITTFLPLIWLSLFISFAIRASIKLGHLPVLSLNDPKDLGFNFHHNLIWFMFFGLLYAIGPLWLGMIIYAKIKKINDLHLFRNIFIFVLSCISIFCLLRFDPYSFVIWFTD